MPVPSCSSVAATPASERCRAAPRTLGEAVVAYTDGEIRQRYETTYIGHPVGGEPTINDEAAGICFARLADLDAYDIHPGMHQQIDDYLAGTYPYLG